MVGADGLEAESRMIERRRPQAGSGPTPLKLGDRFLVPPGPRKDDPEAETGARVRGIPVDPVSEFRHCRIARR